MKKNSLKTKSTSLTENAQPTVRGNEAAIRLLRTWLADDSGYDEQAWALVKKAIEANRLSARKRFDD